MPSTEGVSPGLAPDAPVEDVYTAATEQLDSADGAEHALILVAHGARRAPEMARAVAGHPGLAMVALTGPVTAVGMTDHVLRHSDLSATEGVDVAHGLKPFLRTYAVVSSATRVERPTPSLGTYLLSLLPWTRFGIDLHEGTFVKPAELPRLVAEAAVRVTSTLDERIASDLLPTGPAAQELSLEAPASSWRARHAVECTLLLGTPDDLVSQILSAPSRDCVNCHVPTRLTRCPFCGVRQTSADRKAHV
ncbi:MAG: hypothetical protein Q4P07_09865 [Ornithinimicrobium sp.]|uniref:hypothetical protein n=1 Tax=Ornithinimicrobium sp. TaxID=1977084 RepID=UPI0026E0FD55|nr:hypothetical protein [Ornithinimicrobium sp.]MDO5740441.1 hypothetical protein [Ornithinimicrobium sp.]